MERRHDNSYVGVVLHLMAFHVSKEARVMKRTITVLALALALTFTASVVVAATLYENNFESPASLAGWQILNATGSGIVAGVTPCNVGQNVLWMYGQGNTYATAYYQGGTNWTDYCFSVWGRVTSNAMPYINVFFRIQDINGLWYGINNGYNVHLRFSQGNIELQRVVSGVGYPLATAGYSLVAGTWYNIKVEAGSLTDPYAIKVFVNAACDSNYQQVISTRDTAYRSGSIAVGGLSSGGTGARHDDWFDHVKVDSLDSGGASSTETASWGTIKALYR
jgi:hypothetical protein